MNKVHTIKTGIVLSGGMSKGAYELGFCSAIKEHPFFNISAISAASIGTLAGYSLASDNIQIAKNIWTSFNIVNIKHGYKTIFKEKKIYDAIDNLCFPTDIIRFPLYTVCWIPSESRAIYINLNNCNFKERVQYIKASVTVAPIMSAFKINGINYFDGAIIDNSPLTPLFQYNLDLIIVIQFDSFIPQPQSANAGCPILYLNLQNSSNSNFMDSFNFSPKQTNEMSEYGYYNGNMILTNLENSLKNTDNFVSVVNTYNSNMKKTYNGDYIVRRINKITKQLYPTVEKN